MNASSASAGLPFNPEILRWARDRCGLTIEEVAESFKGQAVKIMLWESGEKVPTVLQGRKLADIYDRPFLEFFSRTVPSIPEVKLVPDFRSYSGGISTKEARELKKIQAWAEEQRLNVLDLMAEMGGAPKNLSKKLRYDVSKNVEEAAMEARLEIGFSISEQVDLKSSEKDSLPKIIREKFERAGVLVLKQSVITKLHARGICMFADPLPIIVFGNEAPSAQAFTLAHEFGHVLLGQSGISGEPRFGSTNKNSRKFVEGWCNKFAAAFLIPENSLRDYIEKPIAPEDNFEDSDLEELAKKFAVSRHAMMIRLVSLGYVKPTFYWGVKRQQFLNQEREYHSQARSAYYGSRYVNSQGKFYTGLVLEAWENGFITSHNAAEYMGIKNLGHLRDIKEHFGR